MKQIIWMKKFTTVSAFALGIFASPLALAFNSESDLTATDCATATATLNAAEASFLDAQMQLNMAQQRCNGVFSCIYPYQSAFSQAQSKLTAAQAAANGACK